MSNTSPNKGKVKQRDMESTLQTFSFLFFCLRSSRLFRAALTETLRQLLRGGFHSKRRSSDAKDTRSNAVFFQCLHCSTGSTDTWRSAINSFLFLKSNKKLKKKNLSTPNVNGALIWFYLPTYPLTTEVKISISYSFLILYPPNYYIEFGIYMYVRNS